jgi:hypothetical protein
MVVHRLTRESRQEHEALRTVLEAIETRRWAGRITTQIFVAMDCDGVCSAHTWVELMRVRSVEHTIVPVSNYTAIMDQLAKLQGRDEIRNLVFLNCGAIIDLNKHAEKNGLHDVNFYVFDSHGPVHEANEAAAENIQVFQDTISVDIPQDMDADSDTDSTASTEDGRKRKRRGKASRKKRRRDVQTSYFTAPVAVTLYHLAYSQACATEQMLWSASIALTGGYVQGHLSENTIDDTMSQRLQVWLEDLGVGKDTMLKIDEDLQLILYRHWSLQDAVTHTDFMYAKSTLWKESGQRWLKSFFVNVGLEPAHYTKNYAALPLDKQRSLLENTVQQADRMWDISNLARLEMIRTDNTLASPAPRLFLQEMSATDMAYCVQAMLEQQDEEDSFGPFYRAMDTLDMDPCLLEIAVKRVMASQRDILSQTKIIMDRRMYKGRPKDVTCRYVILDKPMPAFLQVSAVRRLAMFVLCVIRHRFDKDGVDRTPLAVFVKNEEEQKYLCVGVTDHSQYLKGNPFGTLFQQACAEANVAIGMESFDTAVAEVIEDDFQTFLEAFVNQSMRANNDAGRQPAETQDTGTATETGTGFTTGESGTFAETGASAETA